MPRCWTLKNAPPSVAQGVMAMARSTRVGRRARTAARRCRRWTTRDFAARRMDKSVRKVLKRWTNGTEEFASPRMDRSVPHCPRWRASGSISVPEGFRA
jgi:hypothetical protein